MMMSSNTIWTPQPKQAVFLSRPEYEALYGGAAGGVKSDALLAEALRQVHIPHYKALILRKTFPQLAELESRSTAIYKRAFPTAVYNASKHVWQFPSGARIYFGAMQRVQDRTKYQGQQYDFIGFDELTHFTWDEYSYMFSRNRPSGAGTRVYMRATANPGGVGHGWVKQRFITAAKPMTPIIDTYTVTDTAGQAHTYQRSRIFVPASVFDNKRLLANDPAYLASLAMLPQAERDALLYGNWDSFSGQVFAEWQDDPTHYVDRQWTHVISPFKIPQHWVIVRGFDFGYAKPFSVGWYAIDESDTVYRIREYYGCTDVANTGLKLNPAEIASEIRRIESEDENLRGKTITGIADPSIFDRSRGESVADIMSKAPNFVLWSPGDNARIAGKMQYHYRLAFNADGLAKFYCFSTCKGFLRTIPALVYDDVHVEDIDTTQEDHIYDECRYVLMDHPIAAPTVSASVPRGDDPLDQRVSKNYSFYNI